MLQRREVESGAVEEAWPSREVCCSQAGGFDPELARAFGRGVRFGCQQLGVQVRGFLTAAGRLAKLGAVWGLAFAEQQVIWAPVHDLTVFEAKSLGIWAPPAAWRFAAALAGLDVVPGRILGRTAVDLTPAVLQVVSLAQGHDNRPAYLFPYHPGAATTLTDILADVLGGRMAVSRRDGRAGQDVLRRAGEASVLILISLADGPKHGYALIQDIKELAGVELGPGTLYGALDRLERLGLIEPLPAEDRRHPYRMTAPGAAALRVHLDSLERVSAAGRLRLQAFTSCPACCTGDGAKPC